MMLDVGELLQCLFGRLLKINEIAYAQYLM